jgi:hypothetical protein
MKMNVCSPDGFVVGALVKKARQCQDALTTVIAVLVFVVSIHLLDTVEVKLFFHSAHRRFLHRLSCRPRHPPCPCPEFHRLPQSSRSQLQSSRQPFLKETVSTQCRSGWMLLVVRWILSRDLDAPPPAHLSHSLPVFQPETPRAQTIPSAAGQEKEVFVLLLWTKKMRRRRQRLRKRHPPLSRLSQYPEPPDGPQLE